MGNLLFINKQIYFSFTILWLGIYTTIFSKNWFTVWLGLEINLLGFLLILYLNQKNLELVLKYFIIQRSSSSVFLLTSIFINHVILNLTIINKNLLIFILLIIIVKLGAAPIHFWLINIGKKINWLIIFIILRIQKINPLYILSLSLNNTILFFFIILNALIGRIQGLSQKSLKLIIILSSVSHIGWIFASLKLNFWIIYLLIYSISLLIISFLINKISKPLTTILKIFTPSMYICFILNLLSLGGFPPLIGFFPKWYILSSIRTNLIISFILILSSVINLYFYLHMVFSIFLINKNSWILSFKNIYLSKINIPIIIFPLSGLLLF